MGPWDTGLHSFKAQKWSSLSLALHQYPFPQRDSNSSKQFLLGQAIAGNALFNYVNLFYDKVSAEGVYMAFIASFFRIPVLLPVIFKTIDSRKEDFCTCKTTKSDTIIADIDNFVITKFECADVDSNAFSA